MQFDALVRCFFVHSVVIRRVFMEEKREKMERERERKKLNENRAHVILLAYHDIKWDKSRTMLVADKNGDGWRRWEDGGWWWLRKWETVVKQTIRVKECKRRDKAIKDKSKHNMVCVKGYKTRLNKICSIHWYFSLYFTMKTNCKTTKGSQRLYLFIKIYFISASIFSGRRLQCVCVECILLYSQSVSLSFLPPCISFCACHTKLVRCPNLRANILFSHIETFK